MSDDIRGMTAELAADPDSLVFLDLGDALRRRGQLDAAYKVARTGAARYPELARAHDLCARILCDRGERDRAFEAWVSALEMDGGLVSAHKGLGFLYFQAGDLVSAEKHLAYAGQVDPDDVGTGAALERVQALRQAGSVAPPVPAPAAPTPPAAPKKPEAPPSETPRASEVTAPASAAAAQDEDDESVETEAAGGSELPFSFEESRPSPVRDAVFAGLDGGTDGLLLVDSAGLRLGGGLRNPEGSDVADPVAALLAGVSKEASRTARLLELGEWRGLAVECGDGNLFLSAPTDSTLLLTVRGLDTPMGRVARFAERASAAARVWLERSP
ncbi:MAG TPA: roadblock/LC7 domain-containing protein [Gemmatimonadales bacterium]|nr:roadblock/LC7 domain-containing protein [Gemmatimonadales bacterium]